MSSLRYASVLCLSYQSYRSSQSMTTHLIKMANDVTKSGTLESEASIDHSLAIQYTESAKADQIKAEALQQHAAELEAESAKEEIMSRPI